MTKFLLLIGFLAATALAAPPTLIDSGTHKGVCPTPNPDLMGTCVEVCSSDTDCAMDHKCCSNGCGHTCQLAQPPLPEMPPSGPVVEEGSKVGICPPLKPNTLGLCVEECTNDSDCPDIHKCCSNGCGHTCQRALVPQPATPTPGPMTAKPYEKEGTCPPTRWYWYILSKFGRLCGAECRMDGQCEGDMKCCDVGCGVKCREPVKMKDDKPLSGCATVRCAACHECVGNGKCVPKGGPGCEKKTCERHNPCGRDTKCADGPDGLECRECPVYKLMAPPEGCHYEKTYPLGDTGCVQWVVKCNETFAQNCTTMHCEKDTYCMEDPKNGPTCKMCLIPPIAAPPEGCHYNTVYPPGDTGCPTYKLVCGEVGPTLPTAKPLPTGGASCAATLCEKCTDCVEVDGQAKCVRQGSCCPDDQQFRCKADPCMVTKCAAAPHCKSDYCGGCNAIFFDEKWNEISGDQCNAGPVIEPLPTGGASCAATLCEKCTDCVEVDGQAKCVRRGSCCPDDQKVRCFADPCMVTPCPAATHCKSDYCGGCNAIFYDEKWNEISGDQCTTGGNATKDVCLGHRCHKCDQCVDVEGQPKCIRGDGACCREGQQSVQCFADPCMVTECPAAAHCKSDYCDGCNAIFYDEQWNQLSDAQCGEGAEQ